MMGDEVIAVVRDAGTASGETLGLAFAERMLWRQDGVTSTGRQVTCALSQPQRVRPGDGLRLRSGDLIGVVAQPEDLIAVSGGDLLSMALHLGSRRAPCQIDGARLLILPEPGLEPMLKDFGARLDPVRAAFVPECVAQSGVSVHHFGTSHDRGGEPDGEDDDKPALAG
jgi:urease accessory protein